MNIQLIDEKSKIPTKGTSFSAGSDLYSIESGVILPGHRKLIDTGIRLNIPEGFYGRIAPRSGLAYRYGIDVLAGVIDSDYRGNIKVILYNTDPDNSYEYNIGDRIAQIIITPCKTFQFIKVNNLNETNRQSDGFGSTGK